MERTKNTDKNCLNLMVRVLPEIELGDILLGKISIQLRSSECFLYQYIGGGGG